MASPLDSTSGGWNSPLAWFLIKLIIAAALIGWLIHSGTLDFQALSIFVDRPALLVVNLGVFAVSVLVSTFRWRLLLRIVAVSVPLGRAIKLQLVGLLFNITTPGGVGGDVIKAVMVARDEPAGKRTGVYLVPLVERLIGLVGLLVMAALVLPMSDYENSALANTVLLLAFGGLVGPALLMALVRWKGRSVARRVGGGSRLARLLSEMLEALVLMARNPVSVIWALLLSMLVHVTGMIYFWLLVDVITNQSPSIGTIASVYPLGNLLLIVPITPSGFGVGHVAFEQLMTASGLHSGATVFNVYLIGMLVPAVAGLIPYLTQRHKLTPTSSG